MKKKLTIAVSGKAKSGKDTLFKILNSVDQDTNNSFNFKRMAFADKIKESYCAYKGITLKELEKNKSEHRDSLIMLGSAGRLADPEIWVRPVVYSDTFSSNNVVITDVRFDNEFEYLEELHEYQFSDRILIKVRIFCEDYALISRGSSLALLNDPSEKGISDKTKFDLIISNSDTEEMFRESVLDFYYNDLCSLKRLGIVQ